MKLGEIGRIVTGKTPSTSNEENFNGGIPFYTPTDIAKGYIVEETERTISQQGFDAIINNTLNGTSILVGCIGSDMGNVAITERRCATNQQINAITQISKEHNPYYWYYRLSTMKAYFQSIAGSTATPLLPKSDFENIEISNIPDLQTQNAIASVLSSLDRKISLNRKANEVLESMAKQLYDYWFVQFDFPNAEGKPYKSSGGKMVYNETLKREIPEGWEVGNLLDISNLITGGTPSKAVDEYWINGDIPFFGPTDCDGSMYQFTTEYKITDSGVKHSAAKIMNENCVIITARGSIGKYVITGTPMAMNQSCFAFESKEGNHEHLYFLVGQLIQHLLVKGSGSTFKSIVGIDIENSILCLGDAAIRDRFSHIARPLFAKIKSNTQETLRLTSLRDYLLPLLMNGQVKVL